MKVYIMTDLEGATGVISLDREHIEEAKASLTADINAAIRGVLAQGVEEIYVRDGHWGESILFEELSSPAKLIRGENRDTLLPLLDSSFDALLLIGYHAKADTTGAVIPHTHSRRVKSIRLNGKEVGEVEMCALSAGYFSVPTVFISGDDKAVAEAKTTIKDITGVVVKWGLSRNAALCLSAEDARQQIAEGVARSLRALHRCSPYLMAPPYRLRVEYLGPIYAPLRYLIKGRGSGTKLRSLSVLEVVDDDFQRLVARFFGSYREGHRCT